MSGLREGPHRFSRSILALAAESTQVSAPTPTPPLHGTDRVCALGEGGDTLAEVKFHILEQGGGHARDTYDCRLTCRPSHANDSTVFSAGGLHPVTSF